MIIDANAIDYSYVVVENKAAKDMEAEIWNILHPPESILLGWRNILKKEIQDLTEECSAEGWDGEGTSPISELDRKAAENFIDLLPDNIMPPIITPENTGKYSFNWDRGKNMIYSIEISGDYVVYAGIFGAERFHGKVRIYDEMPRQIHDIITRYFKK